MKRLYTLLAILCAVITATADSYSISGKIIDKQTNLPMQGVGVRLMNADSSYVTGMATSDLGIFIIRPEKPGNYILKISSVGYTALYHNITLNTTKKSAAKVTMSNSELTGPSSSMKPLMDAASQARGRAVQASSTVSHGSAMHTIS